MPAAQKAAARLNAKWWCRPARHARLTCPESLAGKGNAIKLDSRKKKPPNLAKCRTFKKRSAVRSDLADDSLMMCERTLHRTSPNAMPCSIVMVPPLTWRRRRRRMSTPLLGRVTDQRKMACYMEQYSFHAPATIMSGLQLRGVHVYCGLT
jgi:hypothetical protein